MLSLKGQPFFPTHVLTHARKRIRDQAFQAEEELAQEPKKGYAFA